jgi:fluoride exporter
MQPVVRLYLAVGTGAALGSVARVLVSLALLGLLGYGFPFGTLTVNVLGSFVIGLYATLTEPDGRITAGPATRQFVLSGFCGGFTTFSIFSLETLLLVEQQRFALAGLNVGLSIVLWLLAVWLGYRIGARMNRLRGSLS